MDAAPTFRYKSWFSVFGFLLLSVQIWLIATNAANTPNASENQEVWVRLAVLYGIYTRGINQTCVHYWEWYRKTFNGDIIFVFLSISAKLYLSWSLIAEIRQRLFISNRFSLSEHCVKLHAKFELTSAGGRSQIKSVWGLVKLEETFLVLITKRSVSPLKCTIYRLFSHFRNMRFAQYILVYNF
jgi:hypothetical protein